MSMVNVGNLVQIRHWIVPDEDKNDNGYYKTVYKFQNVNPNKGIVYGTNTYSFAVHLQRSHRTAPATTCRHHWPCRPTRSRWTRPTILC